MLNNLKKSLKQTLKWRLCDHKSKNYKKSMINYKDSSLKLDVTRNLIS
jgi:hypothetical protein